MPAIKKIFPAQFSDLLNSKGLQILNSKNAGNTADKIAVAQNIIRPGYVDAILHELNDKLFPLLKNLHRPVPDDIIKKMKKNYSEKLGKSMKMKTAELNSRKSTACSIAYDLGLVDMLSSASYKSMGEAMLGKAFGRSIGRQVICYQHADYVSPHNDHHPENENIKNGYFDIQLMLSNQYVKHQWLVYEQNGFLNSMKNIATPSGIAVYRLPFWHYTTPLIAQPKYVNDAKRWLLLHSFEIAE